jgi:hypothetical protein
MLGNCCFIKSHYIAINKHYYIDILEIEGIENNQKDLQFKLTVYAINNDTTDMLFVL